MKCKSCKAKEANPASVEVFRKENKGLREQIGKLNAEIEAREKERTNLFDVMRHQDMQVHGANYLMRDVREKVTEGKWKLVDREGQDVPEGSQPVMLRQMFVPLAKTVAEVIEEEMSEVDSPQG